MRTKLGPFFGSAAAVLTAVTAYKWDDTFDFSSDGYSWMGKFVFDYSDEWLNSSNPSQGYIPIGVYEVTLTNEDKLFLNDKNWSIVMFDDQSTSFDYAYPFDDNDLTCEERRYTGSDAPVARLKKAVYWDQDGKFVFNYKLHEHIEPRYWWAYLSNCNKTVMDAGPSIHFESHFYQLNSDDWSEELGMNEHGLNTFYLCMFLIWFLICSVQSYAYYKFRSTSSGGNVHLVIKLLSIVVALQFFSVMFHLIEYAVYANSGYPQIWARVVANIFETAASSVFMLLLLVMGSGWTITDIDFEYKKQALFGTIMMFLFKVIVWMWREFALDPESTEYLYDTPPMYVYASIMLVVGIVFVVLVFRSYRSELLYHKKQLYTVIGCVYTLWFATPMIQILIGDAIDAWSRDMVVTVLELCWDTLAFIVMMALLWPDWAARYFHLDRTQVTKQIMSSTPSIQKEDWDRL